MASFSFGSGNVAKLLRIPLYAAGRIATILIPRGTHWVLGSASGVGDGGLALWLEADAAGVDTVWLAGSSQEATDARTAGMRTVAKYSLRGWWATARARVIVVTHGFGDANRYAQGGAIIAQLWHGIPLKRIGLDSSATIQMPSVPGVSVLRTVIRVAYRRAAQRIAVLPAASDRAKGRLESAFALYDGQVVVTGEPRVDVLSVGTPEQRSSRALRLLIDAAGPIEQEAKRVLYAPTWRDGAPDPAIPSAAEWVQIIAVLTRENAVLYVRSHPLGEGAYAPPLPTARVRMLGSAVLRDITPALPGFDLLITDYSSLLYDVGLVGMPVLYLAPDVATYSRERGFYGRYDDVTAGDVTVNWTELLAELATTLTDRDTRRRRSEKSVALSAQMHAYHDGRNAGRVFDRIRVRSLLKGHS